MGQESLISTICVRFIIVMQNCSLAESFDEVHEFCSAPLLSGFGSMILSRIHTVHDAAELGVS